MSIFHLLLFFQIKDASIAKMFKISALIAIRYHLLNHVITVLTATVSSITIQNETVTETGSNITLICTIENFYDSRGVYVYRTDKPDIQNHYGYIARCMPYLCDNHAKFNYYKYRINADNTHVNISIENLTTSQDEAWWTCRDSMYLKSQQQRQLIVYSSPKSIVIGGKINGGDLQLEEVALNCHTSNCIYPAPPQFQWFYRKNSTGQWVFYTNTTGEQSPASCTDSEKIYNTTLRLKRYTIWPTNVETVVSFQCRLSFPTLQTPLTSTSSGQVYYAVRVASVTLIDGDRTPTGTETIETTSGVPKTLMCTPSISRPPATIVWYVDTTEKQRSTSTQYIYTPVYGDNGKEIYCKAFNIQREAYAVSSVKPMLYVKVKVTSVTLYDGNSTPGSGDGIVVTENQNKTLICTTGQSNPVSTISWYIKDQIIQSGTNTNFVFTPTNSDHGGTIYCKAHNIQPPEEAVVSASPKLYVRVLARTPLLSNWTSGSPEIFVGEQTKIICISTATRPAVSVLWKKGSITLVNVQNTESIDVVGLVTVRSTVVFTAQKSDNRRTISCETSIPDQQPQKAEQNMSVWWPPSTPSISTYSFPWLEGQTGRQLKCQTKDYGNPEAEVEWIPSVGTQAQTLLNLPALTKHHHRLNITCQLKNNYTERLNVLVKSQVLQLDVQYKPDIFISVDNMEKYKVDRNEGQSLTAVCNAKGNPGPIVTWQGRATGVSQLVFTDIDRKNHGGYKCIAQATSSVYPNYDFSNETTLQILVNYAPVVRVDLSNLEPVESTPLRITCNAIGRPNNYNYRAISHTWEGVEISNEHIQTGGVIYIREVQLQDSGTYTCVVNNGIPDRNQQLDHTGKRTVIIKVSPKVLFDGINIFAGALGKSFNITVPFYCYPEIKTVMFKLGNDTVLTNSSKYKILYRRDNVTTTFYGQSVQLDGYSAMLYIHDEEMSDFTNYTLVLSNEIGQQTHWSFRHVLEGIPTVPRNFSITSLVDGVPVFSFTRGFNGGRRQTFVVETAEVGTGNWIEQIRFNETDRRFLINDGLTAVFSVTGLAPGTYNVRILAYNDLGWTEKENTPTLTFTVENPSNEEQISVPVAAIAGGTVAALIIIVVVIIVVVIVLRKRKLPKKGNTSTAQKLEDLKPSDASYCDLTGQDDNQQYASLEQDTPFHYESLQEISKDNQEINTYEKLETGSDVAATSPSTSSAGGPNTAVSAEDSKTYENLRI